MYRLANYLASPFTIGWLVSALAFAWCWRKAPTGYRKKLVGFALVQGAFAALCTPVAAFLLSIGLEHRYWPTPATQTDGAQGAQAIVVLGGYIIPPQGARTDYTLGEDSHLRCSHALAIRERHSHLPIIVTGGKVNPQRPGPAIAHVMQEYFLRAGVPADEILIEDGSRTTYENAVNTKKILRRHNFQRVILVTEADHLLRAEGCFRAAGVAISPSPSGFRTVEVEWSVFSFLPSPEGAGGVQAACHEWLGIAWYRIHGRL